MLSENPNIGTLAYYISQNVRKIAVEKHIIFYKVESEKVLILRILHSTMDVQIQNFEF